MLAAWPLEKFALMRGMCSDGGHQQRAAVKILIWGIPRLGVEFWLHHDLTVWPGTNHPLWTLVSSCVKWRQWSPPPHPPIPGLAQEKESMYRSWWEKAMAPHSSTLAWTIPWTEEPGGLQSMGSLRVGHYWATLLWLSCIGEGNGNPVQCSCLENPRDGGAWWAAIYGVA